MTCDAYHMTDPRADGLGVSTCIELALRNAGIGRDQARPSCACAFQALAPCMGSVCCELVRS